MSTQNSDDSSTEMQRRALSAWRDADRSPEEGRGWRCAPDSNGLPPISDELDELLSSYADDLLTPEEEKHLWQLAAREPAAMAHLEDILRVRSRVERWSPQRLTVPDWTPVPKLKQRTGSELRMLSGWTVSLSRDRLNMKRRSGIAAAPSYSMARGPDEPVTVQCDELVLGTCRVEIRVCQENAAVWTLVLQLTNPAPCVDFEAMQVELWDEREVLAHCHAAGSGQVTFSGLLPGQWQLVLRVDDQQVETLAIDVTTDEAGNPG